MLYLGVWDGVWGGGQVKVLENKGMLGSGRVGWGGWLGPSPRLQPSPITHPSPQPALQASDTNKEICVGSDAPHPPGGVAPPPAPEPLSPGAHDNCLEVAVPCWQYTRHPPKTQTFILFVLITPF